MNDAIGHHPDSLSSSVAFALINAIMPHHLYYCPGTYTCRKGDNKFPYVAIPRISMLLLPNQDGTNDRFRAFCAEECEPDVFNLKVFNRWGVLVYESTDPTQAWAGTVNGKRHPTAVLVYWCQYRFPGRDTEELKGDVTLVR